MSRLESESTAMIKKRAFIRTNLPKCKDLRSEFEKEWEKETVKAQNETSFKTKEPDSKSKVIKRRSTDQSASSSKDAKNLDPQMISKMNLKDDFKWKESNQPFSFDFSIES